MRTHSLIQGSSEWLQFRTHHDGSSEIAAVLGLSLTTTRNELMHIKHTGLGKEFSEWVQRNVLDYGHKVEAMVRPLVEAMIGEDLYAVTCSEGRISASLDGLTMSETIAFECKQWNARISELVKQGLMPEEHMPQCQQILLVTGAKRLIFAVGDGTPENLLTMDVFPDAAWFERIRAAWAQFHIDLAAYTPPVVAPVLVAAAQETLPAVSVQLNGSIAIIDNLEVFGVALTAYIGKINKSPQTDQDFVDLKAATDTLAKAEKALDAAEISALASIASVNTMQAVVGTLRELARQNRLLCEKIYKAENDRRKLEIIQGGKDAAAAHWGGLNARLGKPYMPTVAVDFAGAAKNLRTLESSQNAIDTELARFKIEASATCDRIQINLALLRDTAKDFAFLFADTAQIVLKANDDFKVLVESRIAAHKASEAERLEKERDRIRQEEADKLVKAAADKAAADQKLIDAQAASERIAVQAPVPSPAVNVVLLAARIAQTFGMPSTPPLLKLGDISERLGFNLTADFLKSLGFEPSAVIKAAKLYHEHQFPMICAALVLHIEAVQAKQAA